MLDDFVFLRFGRTSLVSEFFDADLRIPSESVNVPMDDLLLFCVLNAIFAAIDDADDELDDLRDRDESPELFRKSRTVGTLLCELLFGLAGAGSGEW